MRRLNYRYLVLLIAFVLWGCTSPSSSSDNTSPTSSTTTSSSTTSTSSSSTSTTPHTVTYFANGAAGSVPVDSATYADNATVTVKDAGSLTNTGDTLAGWMTKSDGTGTSYKVGDTFSMVSAGVTLYAVWVPTGLTLSTSGTGISISAGTVKPTGTLTIPTGVTSIADNGFKDCTGLTSVTIPSSVTSLVLVHLLIVV